MSEMKQSKDFWEKKYAISDGIVYPENHVIKIYEHFMKYRLGVSGSKGEKLLDFGCGNGTHAVYFKSKGFKTYGIDVTPSGINDCKRLFPEEKSNFAVIESGGDIDKLFGCKFDVIFSNQTLYYLSNTALYKTLKQMHDMLNKNGIVIFTQISTKNYYYKNSTEGEDGLRKVELKGRINGTFGVRFVNSIEETIETFKLFKPLFTGYYDFLMGEGPSHHFYFIGNKT